MSQPNEKLQKVIQQFLLDRMNTKDVCVQIIVDNVPHSQHIIKLTGQQINNLDELLTMIKEGAQL